MGQTPKCDVHTDTDPTCGRHNRIEEKTRQLKRAPVADGTLGRYAKSFKYWEKFCNDFNFPVWIDELPRGEQARMVGLFAGLCASEGHNRAKVGNKKTFDGKMAAVAFAHKAVRNAMLDYRDPEFELIAQGYKRTNSQVDRKQPVTTPMLRKMLELINLTEPQNQLLWGSMVLGFFFLDRSSELWGPHGKQVGTDATNAHSIEVRFKSHKGDRIGKCAVIRHYRTSDPALHPVKAAQACLKVRGRWLADKVALGPYLTSVSRKETIKKSRVANVIKTAAKSMGLSPKEYSCHSLQIGGACALLAAGKSDLVIRLMGSVHQAPGMVRDAASSMIKASTWELHEPNLMQLEGEPANLTQGNQA
ncbi:LOW QUALITY PROTEIN: hypothetical protein PHMEG_00036247 [Phytophthora megakarya]|uniref:Tyr recombinase domain-containing protein n=1 Tax=Phytophthora megakarya TaxID=4795 RepID=A0A225UNJ2_9STRA|nr:LOW QUALITY PROTEIN: hypothetical protein PHMEG_00036247 [Phytophthora megakarya]